MPSLASVSVTSENVLSEYERVRAVNVISECERVRAVNVMSESGARCLTWHCRAESQTQPDPPTSAGFTLIFR